MPAADETSKECEVINNGLSELHSLRISRLSWDCGDRTEDVLGGIATKVAIK